MKFLLNFTKSLTASIFPFVARATAASCIIMIASFADSAGLVGAGAGLGEAKFGAELVFDFRLGFEASPFITEGAFDARATRAACLGIAQSGAILRRDALGVNSLGD